MRRTCAVLHHSASREQHFFAPGSKSNGASFAGGAQLGYNLQFDPSFVMGGVVDFIGAQSLGQHDIHVIAGGAGRTEHNRDENV